MSELTAQNQRLADQLREAAKQEEQLIIEVKLLREKCALRSTSLQDHVSSLEVLKDEVRWGKGTGLRLGLIFWNWGFLGKIYGAIVDIGFV